MEKEIFNKEDLDFYLKDEFKSLSKEYMMNCIFNEDIQNNWHPRVGDIIIGCTGNIFVISGHTILNESLGGEKFFFGGSSCSRDGSNFMNSTMCFTCNESGINYIRNKSGELVEFDDPYHSSYKKFRYVPYPHEVSK